jgi:exosortase
LTNTAEAVAEAPPPAAERASHGTGAVPARSTGVVWLIPILGLLAVLYVSTIQGLIECWWNDASYSHGFLVPLLSLALAVRWRRRTQPSIGLGQPAVGLGVLLTGGLVQAIATVFAVPVVDFVGLALVLCGLVFLIGGIDWVRGLWFPIAFLFFMFPLPAVLTSAVAVWLQDVVARVGAEILNVTWVCHRQGNALHLPGVGQPLFVAEECSGLRQLVAFVALAAFLGAWQERVSWQRVLLIGAAIPAALIANVLRILVMAYGARWFGTDWLSGWMHDVPALMTLPLGFGLLLLASWALTSCRRTTWPRGGRPPCLRGKSAV